VLFEDLPLLYEPQAVLQHLSTPTARESLRQRTCMLVVNHHYLFKKNLPQTALNHIAHWWSILGLAIVGITIQRSGQRLLGVIDGLRSVLSRKFPEGSGIGDSGGEDNAEAQRRRGAERREGRKN